MTTTNQQNNTGTMKEQQESVLTAKNRVVILWNGETGYFVEDFAVNSNDQEEADAFRMYSLQAVLRWAILPLTEMAADERLQKVVTERAAHAMRTLLDELDNGRALLDKINEQSQNNGE